MRGALPALTLPALFLMHWGEQAVDLGWEPADRYPPFHDGPGTAQCVLRPHTGILRGVASSCSGNFLLSWADTPNYYLQRFREAQLIDYIFSSLTGHLFGRVFLFLPSLG